MHVVDQLGRFSWNIFSNCVQILPRITGEIVPCQGTITRFHKGHHIIWLGKKKRNFFLRKHQIDKFTGELFLKLPFHKNSAKIKRGGNSLTHLMSLEKALIIKAKKDCTYKKCQASFVHTYRWQESKIIINKFHQGIKKIRDNDKFELITEM